jgi:hypothetical protein
MPLAGAFEQIGRKRASGDEGLTLLGSFGKKHCFILSMVADFAILGSFASKSGKGQPCKVNIV